MTVHSSEHMTIDWQDRVWLETKTWTAFSGVQSPLEPASACSDSTPSVAGPVYLGFVDADPKWPVEKLGPEPTWYLTELAELLDQWNAANEQEFTKGNSCPSEL